MRKASFQVLWLKSSYAFLTGVMVSFITGTVVDCHPNTFPWSTQRTAKYSSAE